jgi:hypothetical protein
MADRVLTQHVPQRAQDGAAGVESGQPFVWREREPAERARDAGLFLIISGIAQIAGSAVVAAALAPLLVGEGLTGGWEITIALGLLLAIAGILVGVIVIVGGGRTQKLRDYRFCRRCCILAMLPLFGFVVGLPFGIWALWVLRRPDVKAAFAESGKAR